MIDKRYKAVGFDMDGTLVDTKIDYKKIFEQSRNVLSEAGVSEEVLNSAEAGGSAVGSALKGQTDLLKSIMSETMKTAISENDDRSELFPGTLDMLDRLTSNGYKIGVLTDSFRERAEKVLKRVGIAERLDVIACADDHPLGEAKPSPKAMEYFAEALGVDPTEVLYLGDYNIDMMSARDAGAGFIGVLSGICTKEEWAKQGITDVIGTVAELKDRV